MTNDLLKKLPQIRGSYKFNEPLKNYTWLNVGGPADVMFFPKDVEDLQFFLRRKPADMELFVLGGGSNLLVRDGGIEGVTVKLSDSSFCYAEIKKDKLVCGAGLLNNALKKTIIEHGLNGLEFLCSIPGSIGGTLRSNAGCFGKCIADVLISAKAVDSAGSLFEIENKDFNFGYRRSDFPADWIITEVSLRYQKANPEQVAELINEQAQYRREHQPQGIRTAGSTFKNPPDMRAWELIKNSGAYKLTFGGAALSPKHCNFLYNDGTASAKDIEDLCDEIEKTVKNEYGVCLELEIKKVGRK